LHDSATIDQIRFANGTVWDQAAIELTAADHDPWRQMIIIGNAAKNVLDGLGR
jgi:hypothetical protein